MAVSAMSVPPPAPAPAGRVARPATKLLVALLALPLAPREAPADAASFSLRVDGRASAGRIRSAFALPGGAVALEVARGPSGWSYELREGDEAAPAVAPGRWRWRAPDAHGLARLRVVARGTAGPGTVATDSVLVHVFVLVPFEAARSGSLNGYRIGAYPSTPLNALPIYRLPRGFVEVTPENADTPVSPHFVLRQFLCKQPGGYPKYLVLDERMLLKLELILAAVNARGHRAPTLHVMSGYRTPAYNRAIGNVRYSRHLWGDAADIFVDVDPPDGEMDDLNGDGRVDHRDADVLYDIVDELFGRPLHRELLGGLGRYRRNAAHGPFVHVDARGHRARWGR